MKPRLSQPHPSLAQSRPSMRPRPERSGHPPNSSKCLPFTGLGLHRFAGCQAHLHVRSLPPQERAQWLSQRRGHRAVYGGRQQRPCHGQECFASPRMTSSHTTPPGSFRGPRPNSSPPLRAMDSLLQSRGKFHVCKPACNKTDGGLVERRKMLNDA